MINIFFEVGKNVCTLEESVCFVMHWCLLLCLIVQVATQCAEETTWSGIVNHYYAGIRAEGSTVVVSPNESIEWLEKDTLLLVIQMQGAHINRSNSTNYGDGSTGSGYINISNVGLFEFTRITSVLVNETADNIVINVTSNLTNEYTSDTKNYFRGKSSFQVVTVPEAEIVTLTGDILCEKWEGITGGIIALSVADEIHLNHSHIQCKRSGFRGGGTLLYSRVGPRSAYTGYVSAPPPDLIIGDAVKGEGISGTPFITDSNGNVFGSMGDEYGYPVGDCARGAPGNAGGGGNEHNSGGGGGGAGGKGGNGNAFRPEGVWVADNGGLGGAAVLTSNDIYRKRLFLGGGGGAGHSNQVNCSAGGTGGGIIIIITRHIFGPGEINVVGGDSCLNEHDGTGGGGAGGTVLIASPTNQVELRDGITINVSGGNASLAAGNHGTGGGGGGGFALHSHFRGDYEVKRFGGRTTEVVNIDGRPGGVGYPGREDFIPIFNDFIVGASDFPLPCSMSSSVTPSTSVTKTTTPSSSLSKTRTTTPSVSATNSLSASNSRSISASPTSVASFSPTSSPTSEPSVTRTPTSCPSTSPTVTRSISPTPSHSVSITRTTTSSATKTDTSSSSLSVSPTPSNSVTASVTPTVSLSPEAVLVLVSESTSPLQLPTQLPSKIPSQASIGVVTVAPFVSAGVDIVVGPPSEDAVNQVDQFDVISDVIDIIFFQNGQSVQPNGPVRICLRVDSKEDACLSYYDEDKREWICEDPCLSYVGDTACGETDHLTNFAVLLTGGKNGIDGRCSSVKGNWIFNEGWQDGILIGCVAGLFCCFVFLVILGGMLVPRARESTRIEIHANDYE